MQDEITAAAVFLIRLIGKNANLNKEQLEEFKNCLVDIMVERFENHWFPENPCRGQGYRCIRINEVVRRDCVIEKATRRSGLRYEDLGLPTELTVWVDPYEVCCRFGEHKGSFCTVASFKDGNNKENEVINLEMLQKSAKHSVETMGEHHRKGSFLPKQNGKYSWFANFQQQPHQQSHLTGNGNSTQPFASQLPRHFPNDSAAPRKIFGKSVVNWQTESDLSEAVEKDHSYLEQRPDRYHWVKKTLG